MKISLYIDTAGQAQIVLDPEDQREKKILDLLPRAGSRELAVDVHRGKFTREKGRLYTYNRDEEKQAILVVYKRAPEEGSENLLGLLGKTLTFLEGTNDEGTGKEPWQSGDLLNLIGEIRPVIANNPAVTGE